MRGPREAASKRRHENIVAGADAIRVGCFRDRNRNRGRRQIAVTIDIRECMFARNTESSPDRFNYPKVGLVRNHEINILD
jgi:hypothetical protein